MSNIILKCNNLNKSFGKRKILKNVTFSINKGDILGFIGPNGSGKTTTIKCILGLNKIHEKYPNVPIYAPIGDKDLINEVDSFVDRYLGGFGRIDVPPITKYIDSNENLTIGLENIKIIQAPGHTKGGVCYFVDDKLFSGDTIFLESVGRTDLPGGNFEQLKSSIVNILANLSDDIVIYTGHGMTTTVKHEKENNPVL